MAISHELSSEIATALLTADRSPEELTALKTILLEVHSVLQAMGDNARPHRHMTAAAATPATSQGPTSLSNS